MGAAGAGEDIPDEDYAAPSLRKALAKEEKAKAKAKAKVTAKAKDTKKANGKGTGTKKDDGDVFG